MAFYIYVHWKDKSEYQGRQDQLELAKKRCQGLLKTYGHILYCTIEGKGKDREIGTIIIERLKDGEVPNEEKKMPDMHD